MKRIFDIILASIAFFFLSPVFLCLYFLIKEKLGAPVFFRQTRPGLHGAPFEMIKFRSMTNCTDENGVMKPDEERLTRFGAFLRSTSLDELPELWNVFKGEMSIVGPRPLLMRYLPLYSAEQARRHNVRPGITGWAQINGRNAVGWDDRFKLDIWYVDNMSLLLDIKILFLTVKKVLARADISSGQHATMTEFKGNAD